jgi:hypothetical protein
MTTTKMLNDRFLAFTKVCELMGIIPPAGKRWGLDSGSKTYGRAFRIFWVDSRTGAHHSAGTMSDFLGMTKAEAYEALGQRMTMLWAIDSAKAIGVGVKPVEPAEYLDGLEVRRNVAPLSR